MKRTILPAIALVLMAFLSGDPVTADGAAVGSQNGDVNGDAALDLSDAIYLINYMFVGGPQPAPLACSPHEVVKNGDVDGSGSYEITDPIRLLTFLFLGGEAPVEACP